ncbi:MAG: PQQ-dependent sugar dehydrogenase [bacterium]
MKKLIFLFLFLCFVNVKAQFKIVPAFPNLPDFLQPTELVNSGDGTNRLFLVQQTGIIYVFHNSPTVNTRKVFLNLSARIGTSSPYSGMLGLAFHPNYINNRYFYVQYSIDSASSQYGHFWVKLSRFTASPTNPDSALPNSELNLMTVNCRGEHFGGKVAFHNSLLYNSIGDGADGGDSAQDRTNLLGKVLRINVDAFANGKNYSIPSTNPYYNNAQGYRQEIYAYGLRNPYKFSFDVPTNRLWLGDVGADEWEEIDIIQSGKNYGWNKMEGFHCYPDTLNCDTLGRGFTRPVFEYRHANVGVVFDASITGGYVYRGSLLPDLFGKYIYGEFVEGKIWALDSNMNNQLLIDTNFKIATFGVDENKEIYVCSFNFGIPNSKIFKLVNDSKILKITAYTEGFYNQYTNTMFGDTIRVFLTDDDPPYTISDSAKGYLNSSGNGIFAFTKILNYSDLRIVIKHRNSIETWGNEAVFINDTLSYNLTTAASQAYGNNLKLKGTKYCIYTGDVNQDGAVDLDDVSLVENDTYNFVLGYKATDLNGDGLVDVSDVTIADNNAYNFVVHIIP